MIDLIQVLLISCDMVLDDPSRVSRSLQFMLSIVIYASWEEYADGVLNVCAADGAQTDAPHTVRAADEVAAWQERLRHLRVHTQLTCQLAVRICRPHRQTLSNERNQHALFGIQKSGFPRRKRVVCSHCIRHDQYQ